MKRITFHFNVTVLLLLSVQGFTQTVGINTDGSLPHPSAILDVKSFTKGMLLPRTSTTSRNAIVNPAKGLILYDTTTSAFWFHNGTAWAQLSAGSNGWNLTGNASTNPLLNFIGTTDNQPLRFRVNNTWAGEIHPTRGNISFGIGAGQSNTIGTDNTATGEYSLFTNTTGVENTATGSLALFFNTSGSENTASGGRALYNNTTGTKNTASGNQALTLNTIGNENTANGYRALFSNTTGSFNTATGVDALLSNNTGADNTANGYQVLYSNTTGIANVANGYQALYSNTTGNDNTANGSEALLSNVGGIENTGIGSLSLTHNVGGNDNTAVGYGALGNNIAGYENTAIGALALNFYLGGNDNTAIGFETNTNTGASNATAIGAGAIANASNKIRLGNAYVTVIEGQVAYSFPSDARFKYNIKNNVPGLDFIKKLTPVTYYLDVQKLDAYSKTGIINNNILTSPNTKEKQLHTGFLAQDVEKIVNELGYEFDGLHAPVNGKDHYSLAYSQFIMPLVKAMQEQQVVIENLQRQVETKSTELPIVMERQQLAIQELKKEIDEMKKEIQQLKK